MRCLEINYLKCEACGKCEILLPKFKSVYGGNLMICETKAETEGVIEAIAEVKKTCPTGAIIYRKI